MLTCFSMPLPDSAADEDEDRVLPRLVPGLGLMPLPDSATDGDVLPRLVPGLGLVPTGVTFA